jgi:pimeloyl-ACP methyl ester carboxylesterase
MKRVIPLSLPFCLWATLSVTVLTLTMNALAADVPRKAGEIVVESATLDLSTTEKIDYELGTLYVPENRSEPKSRIIGVGFARFKATTATGTPPTFHLPGGPGMSFVSGLSGFARFMLRFRVVGDVVIVDQRGFSRRGDVMTFGFRTPQQPLDQPGSLDRARMAYLQLAHDAVAAFEKQGYDLRGYTVKECAEDVNDLRKALGYERISLVGTSFGSQWSFAVMRLHPEIVARALLSGVEPLDFGYDSPSGVLAAIRRIWNDAEKDLSLQPYIPAGGIEAAAKDILNRLERAPVTVQATDKGTGETVAVTLGKEDFQRDFGQTPAAGPAWVLSLYHEHYETWAASVLARRRSRSDQVRLIGPLIDTSLGVTPGREQQLRSDPATEFLGQWNWDAYIASKDIWPSADVGDDFRTAVETSVPVIFAQGDWDTKTPMENTLEIIRSFPNGRVILVERGGHGVLEPIAGRFPKVWDEVLDFLRTGAMPNLPGRVTLPVPKFAVPDFGVPGRMERR